ncbi:squalene/phytoene synthase family protein [Actinocatenispora comari]|jgi:phytoene synthase|uniref:Squalene synthase HpnD n=1 Tax=Actinocatenispora comari TaxID=2807577 RepID=A0A8J4AGY9_9ACTN|nr:squalene/phytoene synthase family protein [Actinocatenispora comari]GIL31111.1 squalene synthase HpnD [Actinocatenispora comari]
MTVIEAAYQHCEQVTRTEARNFSYGIRLLPPDKRRALSAVYALARRIDDIGDGTASVDERLAGLAAVRADLKLLADPDAEPHDPVLYALTDAARRFPIPLSCFDELIDGCEADVRGTSYRTLADLVGYCRQVAGSVGRLSLGVFLGDPATPAAPDGSHRITVGAPLPIEKMLDLAPEPATADSLTDAELADVLGVALQLTNILRDVLEDRRNDRIYLPKQDLQRFGVRLKLSDSERDGVGFDDERAALAGLIRFEAARAGRWYTIGLQLLPRLDHRSAACTGAMAGIYHALLRRIWRDPLAVTHGRLSLPGRQKALVAGRALLPRRGRQRSAAGVS